MGGSGPGCDMCVVEATCVDGNPVCSCPAGFTGDGTLAGTGCGADHQRRREATSVFTEQCP